MPAIGTDGVAARVPFKHASAIEYEAKSRGVTRNQVLGEIIAAWYEAQHEAEQAPQDEPRALYGVALTLVDELVAEGYPESEIKGAFGRIRDEML